MNGKGRRKDWLMTARQTLPRLTRVLREMKPTFSLGDVREIDFDFLAGHEIEALIWDVDGTLMSYHAKRIAAELSPHMDELFAATSLEHAVLSNCDETRFEELKDIFPHVPLIRAYRGPEGVITRTARGGSDTHTLDEIRALLDLGYEQIRKPSADLILHALSVIAVPGERTVMVGDQYLTDVASANLGGIRSVKVDTFARNTFPRSIRFSQRLERILYRMVNGRA